MSEGRFTIADTPLPGLKRVERRQVGDARGFLARLYCDEELAAAGFVRPVRQINQTLTRERGTIRGMHFQHPPHGEDKLVGVLAGEVFDVAVDLRRDSPTFLQWHGERLSADNGAGLFIPRGFAHGFQTLTEDCMLLYLHTERYRPDAEGALNALDPALGIAWPLAATTLSARDRAHALLSDDFTGI